MSGNTTTIERLLEVSNKLWDAMYESGEVPTYAERAYYYLALKDAMDENAKLRHDLEEANNQAEEVCIENAKLRKLVHDLLHHIEHPPCEGCMAEMSCLGDVSQCDEYCDWLKPRARELGIEVDE